MPDFLSKLVDDAKKRVSDGYYDVEIDSSHKSIDTKAAVKSSARNAIIAEIKPASPSHGSLRPEIDSVRAATEMMNGGAVALSILTEPDNFVGSLENLRRVREHIRLPLLMKDIVIDEKQIEAGRRIGADIILLIEPIFSRYLKSSLTRMIRLAHESDLQVLVEVHAEEELKRALNSDADMVGLNNRDLSTLKTNLETTLQLASKIGDRNGKLFISESGFESAEDVRRIKSAAVDGFLIGSSIMRAENLESKVREFVLA